VWWLDKLIKLLIFYATIVNEKLVKHKQSKPKSMRKFFLSGLISISLLWGTSFPFAVSAQSSTEASNIIQEVKPIVLSDLRIENASINKQEGGGCESIIHPGKWSD
jgi:hypothetical protein